jgi:hypothetical protein
MYNMALADDIYNTIYAEGESKRCKLFSIGLSDTEMDAVLLYVEKIREDKALDQPQRWFTVAGLRRLLHANGHPIGKTVLSEHIRKVCTCER